MPDLLHRNYNSAFGNDSNWGESSTVIRRTARGAFASNDAYHQVMLGGPKGEDSFAIPGMLDTRGSTVFRPLAIQTLKDATASSTVTNATTCPLTLPRVQTASPSGSHLPPPPPSPTASLGQTVYLTNVDAANTVFLQDQDALAGSNLQFESPALEFGPDGV